MGPIRENFEAGAQLGQGRPTPSSFAASIETPWILGSCGGTCRSQLSALAGKSTGDAAVVGIIADTVAEGCRPDHRRHNSVGRSHCQRLLLQGVEEG